MIELTKRLEDAKTKLKEFFNESMALKGKDALKERATHYEETVHRLKIQVNEGKEGLVIAKRAFDDLKAREEQRIAEKEISLRFAEYKINILEFLMSSKKILPKALKDILEG